MKQKMKIEFTDYWNSLNRDDQLSLAQRANTSAEYLYQIASGRRKAGWETCENLESATNGQFNKFNLRPDRYTQGDQQKSA